MNLILAALVLLSTAWAGEKGGNGGYGVVCKTGNTTSIETLDLFETRQRFQKEPLMGSSSANVHEHIQALINRHKYILPTLMNELDTFEKSFISRVIFIDSDLVDVQDSGPVNLPENCEIVQVVIRNDTIPVKGKDFLIDSRFWNRMSAKNQAVMVMHEFLYMKARMLGHTNSVLARQLNSYLLIPSLWKGDADLSFYMWAQILNGLNFQTFEWWGTSWEVCEEVSNCKGSELVLALPAGSYEGSIKENLKVTDKRHGEVEISGRYLFTVSEDGRILVKSAFIPSSPIRKTYRNEFGVVEIEITGSVENSFEYFGGTSIQIHQLEYSGYTFILDPACRASSFSASSNGISMSMIDGDVKCQLRFLDPKNKVDVLFPVTNHLFLYFDQQKKKMGITLNGRSAGLQLLKWTWVYGSYESQGELDFYDYDHDHPRISVKGDATVIGVSPATKLGEALIGAMPFYSYKADYRSTDFQVVPKDIEIRPMQGMYVNGAVKSFRPEAAEMNFGKSSIYGEFKIAVEGLDPIYADGAHSVYTSFRYPFEDFVGVGISYGKKFPVIEKGPSRFYKILQQDNNNQWVEINLSEAIILRYNTSVAFAKNKITGLPELMIECEKLELYDRTKIQIKVGRRIRDVFRKDIKTLQACYQPEGFVLSEFELVAK